MPKIVDHDAYRAELVKKAVSIFRRHGFNGLGMRQIAQELGVSKSSLYHYFPGKQALFDACGEVALALPEAEMADATSPEARYEALVAVGEALDQEFKGELTLLLDYMRPLPGEEARDTSSMHRALEGLHGAVAGIVGQSHARPALEQMLGILLIRVFDGGEHDFTSLRRYC